MCKTVAYVLKKGNELIVKELTTTLYRDYTNTVYKENSFKLTLAFLQKFINVYCVLDDLISLTMCRQ